MESKDQADQQKSNNDQPPATNSQAFTSRMSTGLGMKVIGSAQIKAAAEGKKPATSTAPRQLARGSRALAAKQGTSAADGGDAAGRASVTSEIALNPSVATTQVVPNKAEEEKKAPVISTPFSRASTSILTSNHSSVEPLVQKTSTQNGASKPMTGLARRRTTVLSDKDFDSILSQSAPSNTRATIAAAPRKDEIIHEVEEDDDSSPKGSGSKNASSNQKPGRDTLQEEDDDSILASMGLVPAQQTQQQQSAVRESIDDFLKEMSRDKSSVTLDEGVTAAQPRKSSEKKPSPKSSATIPFDSLIGKIEEIQKVEQLAQVPIEPSPEEIPAIQQPAATEEPKPSPKIEAPLIQPEQPAEVISEVKKTEDIALPKEQPQPESAKAQPELVVNNEIKEEEEALPVQTQKEEEKAQQLPNEVEQQVPEQAEIQQPLEVQTDKLQDYSLPIKTQIQEQDQPYEVKAEEVKSAEVIDQKPEMPAIQTEQNLESDHHAPQQVEIKIDININVEHTTIFQESTHSHQQVEVPEEVPPQMPAEEHHNNIIPPEIEDQKFETAAEEEVQKQVDIQMEEVVPSQSLIQQIEEQNIEESQLVRETPIQVEEKEIISHSPQNRVEEQKLENIEVVQEQLAQAEVTQQMEEEKFEAPTKSLNDPIKFEEPEKSHSPTQHQYVEEPHIEANKEVQEAPILIEETVLLQPPTQQIEEQKLETLIQAQEDTIQVEEQQQSHSPQKYVDESKPDITESVQQPLVLGEEPVHPHPQTQQIEEQKLETPISAEEAPFKVEQHDHSFSPKQHIEEPHTEVIKEVQDDIEIEQKIASSISSNKQAEEEKVDTPLQVQEPPIKGEIYDHSQQHFEDPKIEEIVEVQEVPVLVEEPVNSHSPQIQEQRKIETTVQTTIETLDQPFIDSEEEDFNAKTQSTINSVETKVHLNLSKEIVQQAISASIGDSFPRIEKKPEIHNQLDTTAQIKENPVAKNEQPPQIKQEMVEPVIPSLPQKVETSENDLLSQMMMDEHPVQQSLKFNNRATTRGQVNFAIVLPKKEEPISMLDLISETPSKQQPKQIAAPPDKILSQVQQLSQKEPLQKLNRVTNRQDLDNFKLSCRQMPNLQKTVDDIDTPFLDDFAEPELSLPSRETDRSALYMRNTNDRMGPVAEVVGVPSNIPPAKVRVVQQLKDSDTPFNDLDDGDDDQMLNALETRKTFIGAKRSLPQEKKEKDAPILGSATVTKNESSPIKKVTIVEEIRKQETSIEKGIHQVMPDEGIKFEEFGHLKNVRESQPEQARKSTPNRSGKALKEEEEFDILKQIENLEMEEQKPFIDEEEEEEIIIERSNAQIFEREESFVQNIDTLILQTNQRIDSRSKKESQEATFRHNEGSGIEKRSAITAKRSPHQDQEKSRNNQIGGSAKMSAESNSEKDIPKRVAFIQSRTDDSSIGRANRRPDQKPAHYRMTLRDLNMNIPEDNSSLESDEDKDNYLDWLLEQDKSIKASQVELSSKEGLQGTPTLDTESFLFERKTDPDATVITKKPKKPKQRDLIDVIEEMEDEESDHHSSEHQSHHDSHGKKPMEEFTLDSDQEDTHDYYTKMYRGVLKNKRDDSIVESGPNDLLLEIAKVEEGNQKVIVQEKVIQKKDLMQVIDLNERKYQEEAKQLIKKNSILTSALNNQNHTQIRTRIVSDFKNMNAVTSKLQKEHQLIQAQSTCVGISNEYILVGNSEGTLQMFQRDNERYYATFSEKSKDFVGNAVTCIDVHPLMPQYVIIGYSKGQMILLDIVKQPNKSLKVIKEDSQRSIPIVSAKFCDWSGPQGKFYGLVKNKISNRQSTRPDESSSDNQQSWMIISIDADGTVAISCVIKVLIVYKVNRYVVIDPKKNNSHMYQIAACRFQSPVHGAGIYDNIAMIAIANRDKLMVIDAKQENYRVLLSIDKPDMFFNKESNIYEPFRPSSVPAIAWGFGMSPLLKDRPHSMLAIGWGPLITLIVIIDHEEADQPFVLDGYYIVRTFDMGNLQIPKRLSGGDPFMEVEEEAK